MPRKRLNNNPLLVYAYRAYLPGVQSFEHPPGCMKDEARAGMDYWNDLVRIGNQDTEEYQALIAETSQVKAAQKQVDLLDACLKQGRQDIKNLSVQNGAGNKHPQ